MIGYLAGNLIRAGKGSGIIDVSGVGYEIIPCGKLLEEWFDNKTELKVFVHSFVREDQFTLYGFSNWEEVELFRLLISVSGVGPKVARSIMSVAKVDEIKSAVSKADTGFFTKIPGIGKKNGQRIIIDLRGKIGELAELELDEKVGGGFYELVGVLRGMGFKANEIRQVESKIDHQAPIQEQIKSALKLIG